MANTGFRKKLPILFFFIGAVLLFQLLDLGRYLNLASLKASSESLTAYYHGHPLLTISGYMLIYIMATALSLPGAVILTLAGGALFGLAGGTVIISFASSIGATLACLASRYLFKDWVQNRFGDKLQKINRGMEEEGAFYLFTLRLVPIFPFFIINLLMGLTSLPIKTYYLVSQLGMLPATVVYVNAGRQLAKIDSPAGIVSPGLLLSFAFIGLIPLTGKKISSYLRNKRNNL